MAESTKLAYRFREENVKKYADNILLICQRWPDVVKFEPANVETFSCRLRDAIRSYRENQWPAPFDLDGVQIMVVIRGTRVLAGSRPAIAAWTGEENPTDVTTALPPSGHIILNPSTDSLKAVMQLHHDRILTTPSTIRFDEPASFNKDLWEQSYDVSIDPVDANTFRVL